MKRATTLQFRKAVRKVLDQQCVGIISSWTNGAPARYKVETGTRTVGIRLAWFGASVSPAEIVRKVEKKLAKKGLTAMTRFTDASGNYRVTWAWDDGDAIDVNIEDYH